MIGREFVFWWLCGWGWDRDKDKDKLGMRRLMCGL